MRRKWWCPALCFLLAASSLLRPSHAAAQDGGDAPVAKKNGIQITFLPPPMEGRLSLGLYDKSGKLVRTLCREALEKDFVIGLNGLITTWDGKDSSGVPVPPGKYSARGYSVGEVQVEGVAFHCNEWMSEEGAPKISQIVSIHALPGSDLLVHAMQSDGASIDLRCGQAGTVRRASASDSAALEVIIKKTAVSEQGGGISVHAPLDVRDGVLSKSEDGKKLETLSLPGLEQPIDACQGLDRAVWVIDKTGAGVEVKEYSSKGELLRRLAIPAGEPEPSQIAASIEKDVIYLFERNAKLVRLRGLALEPSAAQLEPEAPQRRTKNQEPGTKEPSAARQEPEASAPAASTWKTFLSKHIIASDSFAAVADQLGRAKPFKPEDKIRVRLLPNPLFKDASQDVDLRIASDAMGSYFQSADGLFLRRITETPHLKWSVMGREGGKVITIFQSDGAVVEEFKARRFSSMMAFDAGEYEVAK